MAVIDTSMEFPKNCHDCQHTSCTYYFAPWLKTDEYKTKRYEKCPLKSTDELRKEVLEYIDDLDIANEICGVFDKYKGESEDV